MESPAAASPEPLAPQGSLFARLREAASEDWERYVCHGFVEQLRRGTLAEESFRHYLKQDYRFLIHFSRAWALAAYKAGTLADLRAAAATMHTILDHEMALHVDYCRSWGIDEEQLEDLPEATATMAYTRYVLERGLGGDVLDLHVALAPCVIGYAEIGARLLREARDDGTLDGNPYRAWMELYAGEEFQDAAREAVTHLDRLAETRAGGGRFENLAKTFRQATRLEVGFWQMGLDRSL